MFNVLIEGTRRTTIGIALAVALAISGGTTSSQASNGPDDGRDGNRSVAARLGGFPGILGFLDRFVVPAELADPEIAPFFANLTETPGDIETCLAMLLDHDLGGSS